MRYVSKYKTSIAIHLIMILIVCTIYIPMMYKQHYIDIKISDYPAHARFAAKTIDLGVLQTPHFLWQAILVGIKAIFFLNNYIISSFISIILIYYCLHIVIYRLLHQHLNEKAYSKLFALFFTFLVMIITPILLPTAIDKHLYFGYIGLATYHNPTIVLLKLLVIIQFFSMIKYMSMVKVSKISYLVSALLIILCTLAKPSYTICLLPAISVYILYSWIRNIYINVKYATISIIVPSIIILLWQFYYTYQSIISSSMSDSSIIFDPLSVIEFYSPHFIILKFFLSIAFPLAFIISYGRISDNYLILAYIIATVGISFMYLLSESGSRKYDANFFWSAQIGLFLLLVNIIYFIFNSYASIFTKRNNIKNTFIFLFLVLHIISGIAFYILELTASNKNIHIYW